MAMRLGTGNVLFRVGSRPPSKVFVGGNPLQTVPGAPTMGDSCSTHLDGPAHEATTITFYPPASDGGSPILDYELWVDNQTYESWSQGFTQGFYPGVPAAPYGSATGQWYLNIQEDLTGIEVTLRARNAIGYGPLAVEVIGQYC